MPSKTKKQAAFMQAIMHKSDKKGGKFAAGGDVKTAQKIDQVNAKMRGKENDTAKSAPKYAKGGKIDGCASRGRTKAMRKGGKC